MNEMYAYNEGLLALGKLSPEFEEGEKALKKLLDYVDEALPNHQSAGEVGRR
jgi:hypothetical protein